MRRKGFSRREVLAGLGAVGAAAVVPGCSGGGGGKSSVLQVWGGVPAASGPQAVVEAFEKKFPQYKVNYTRFVNDERGNLKLDTALQGGLDIDVYFTYAQANLALRAGSGLAADLTERVRADPDLQVFLDTDQPRAYLDNGRVKALATAREPFFVLFNEKLRQQAGVELPQSWTIEDYRATAKRLTTHSTIGAYTIPDLARIALGPNYWYDGDKSNFGNPHFEQGFRLGREMIAEGSVFPWSEVLSRHLNAYQQNSFLKAEFHLWSTAPFNLRYLYDAKKYPHDFKVSFAPPPTVDGNDWNGGAYSNFVMVNPKSPKADAAWEFVKFWLTEGSAPMLKGGKLPTLGNVTDDQVITGMLGKEPDKFFDVDSFNKVVLTKEQKLATDTRLTGFPEISLAYNQQRDLCWLGEKDPAPAIDEVRRLADAAIARNERSSE
ncbi:multiple sugar transport system substrate-binding protein [Kribbella sp. VKM Ac-2527]|uniref:Multiple sugar transport system substrate-binding protein n=1 Tax=Kribbella caucasensis TaxID=2512215 RepID=A0A4R6KFX8_9ACTN|nr:ABC transporter substrate-binding protein [Kribbella sp. VKM Ac-2527]TDO49388.1 multiple sugar transport system substrate-binding protein [Kribbella sp. VKM Ac-2527]